MDTRKRYSVCAIVESTNMINVLEVVGYTWLSEFWTPNVLVFDQAFNNVCSLNS